MVLKEMLQEWVFHYKLISVEGVNAYFENEKSAPQILEWMRIGKKVMRQRRPIIASI